MPSLNKVLIIGHLTRDPQLSYLPSQAAVAEFGLAMNRKYKKQDGSPGEEVCFVNCLIFGKRAEVIRSYFKKGDPIFVEGRLRFESWTADGGSNRSRLRVFVENFEFVGHRSKAAGDANTDEKPDQAATDTTDNTPPGEIPF